MWRDLRWYIKDLKLSNNKYSYFEGTAIPLNLVLQTFTERKVDEAFAKITEFRSKVILSDFAKASNARFSLSSLCTERLFCNSLRKDYVLSLKRRWCDGMAYRLKNISQKFLVKTRINKDWEILRLRIVFKPIALFFQKVFEMPAE